MTILSQEQSGFPGDSAMSGGIFDCHDSGVGEESGAIGI